MIKRVFRIIKKEKKTLVLICLLSLIIPVLSNLIPELNSRIINAIVLNSFKEIIAITIIVVGMYVAKTSINIFMQNRIIKLNLDIVTKLKMEITSCIINQPISFHDSMSSQYIVCRINEVDNFSKLFSTEIFSMLTSVLTAFVALLMIAQKSILVAIISLFLLPFFFVVSKMLFKKMSAQINNSLEASAKANESLHTTLMGTFALKQLNEEDELLKNVCQDMQKLALKLSTQNITINKSGNMLTMITYIVQTILLGIVGIIIAQNQLLIGDYVALGQYFGLLFAPVISAQAININIKPAIVAMKRMDEFVKDNKAQKEKEIREINQIEVKNLKFEYKRGEEVLNDVSFNLKTGEKLLITGANGSGKTTLAKILCGFYTEYSGEVLLNKIEVKDISETCLRNHIAMMSQKTYLFNTSILENIRMANREVGDMEFERRIARWKSIGLLNNINLEENVIENGKQLSGGQIQRIALARILHREADVYIFDELVNSLDSDTKEVIKEVIQKEFDNKICIFIAHDNLLDDVATSRYQL